MGNNNEESEQAAVPAGGSPHAVDWAEVDKIDGQLGLLSFSAARVELEGLGGRVSSEKKKLKGLVSKHTAALEEVARVRREIASERDGLLDEHNRLEGELAHVSSRGGEYSSGEVAQVEQELALLRKKMDSKKSSHSAYLGSHLNTVKKRERLVLVQAKHVSNLLHRRLALGQRVFAPKDGGVDDQPAAAAGSSEPREEAHGRRDESRTLKSRLGSRKTNKTPYSSGLPQPGSKSKRRPVKASS